MDTLILRIDPMPEGADEYPVSLLRLPGNELLGEISFGADLVPPGLNDPLTIAEILSTFANTSSESDLLPRIGEQLYGLIGQGPFDSHFDHAGGPQRLLLDIRPQELRSLPWELMARNGVQIMANSSRPICRGLWDQELDQDLEWPLRVLIVVGSKAGDRNVQAEAEVAAIVEAIREKEADIDLLILNRPQRRQILEAFEDPMDAANAEPHQGFKPHVFHFIGHGGIRTGSGESYLQLWDEVQQGPVQWFAADVRNDFVMRSTPRLVIVNACRTAAGKPNGGLWSVTDAFQEAGVPAVIGMRTVVTAEHARLFAGGLYQALVRDRPLDVAAVEARRRVFQEVTNSTRRLEWAAPTLQVSADPDTIIQVGHSVDEEARRRVQEISLFRDVRGLVDRRPQRLYAWRNAFDEQYQSKQRVLVVLGEAGAGKSAFARMIMERCTLCGHQLRYVDMAGVARGDALAVLRRICDGDGTPADEFSLTSALPEAAFVEFRATVAQALGESLSERSALTVVEPVEVKRIFEAFQRGLEEAIERPPLVIVLDHLAEIDEEQFRSMLIPHLITWCARRQDANIHLVLLVRQRQYDDFQLDTVSTRFRIVRIGDFESERWRELAQECVKRNLRPPNPGTGGADPVQLLDALIDSWGKNQAGRWKPGELDMLVHLAQGFGWQRVQ